MKRQLKNLNYFLSEKYVDLFRYNPYIQTILIHKIFRNREELIPKNGDPLEGIDKNQFETFIKFFSKRNVQFINEEDILLGKLNPEKHYIYLTFDDGYYNNFFCLDILEKYKVKATFMISTNHVKYEKAFWWDVMYREIRNKKTNKPIRYLNTQINVKNKMLYNMKWQDQENFILNNFGINSLIPNNDLDRPMNQSELKLFASHPYVTLGNHTDNHINMTLYNEKEIAESIQSAEEFLSKVTQQHINTISYPHGFCNNSTFQTMSDLGYKIGVTVEKGKNNVSELATNKSNLLKLKRSVLSGYSDIEEQCRIIHTNFSLYSKIKKILN